MIISFGKASPSAKFRLLKIVSDSVELPGPDDPDNSAQLTNAVG